MESSVRYNFPTRIEFGAGVSTTLSSVLKEAGCQRPAFVTDRGVKGLPWFENLVQAVSKDFPTALFSDMGGNPVVSQVDAGVNALRAHHADAIVAVGGGAPIDVAKAIGLMLHHPGHLFDYEDGLVDAPPVDGPFPFIVAIPTTAGTGSEVGRSSVVSDNETHAKKIIFSPRMLPPVVLADPELTLSLPAHLTAATGFDALTHLVEAFLVDGVHPMCDGIALEGVNLVARSLKAAVEAANGLPGTAAPESAGYQAHLAARADLLNAAMMGAVAFQKGLGVNHSCAHALSTVCDTHHGLANAVMLETCMTFNLEVARSKFQRLSDLVGVSTAGPAGFISWITTTAQAVGLPAGLGSLGIDPDCVDDLVAVALADGCHPLNPRKVTAEDFRALFLKAFEK